MSRPLALVVFAGLFLILSIASCSHERVTAPAAGNELDSPYLLGATTGSANYIHVFARQGTYPYHCTLQTHGDYREGGIVFVSSEGPESVFVRIFEGHFTPESATVRVNGQVRWQNFDEGTHHTVTSG